MDSDFVKRDGKHKETLHIKLKRSTSICKRFS